MTDTKIDLSGVKEAVASLSDAYEAPKVLNPENIGGSLLDRMPNPTGWRILVLPYRGKGKTEKGLYMPDTVVEQPHIVHRQHDLRHRSICLPPDVIENLFLESD